MLFHVATAQEKAGTHWEVVKLEWALHEDPKRMRKRTLEALDTEKADDTAGGSPSRRPPWE